ncbi:hypothetical protein S40293_11592 [Stachybotrys chartarum IBT 40293]|nr:hypothetical protein S40293_11592 [Stachybotrys chartarum IBT 40293]
MNVKRLPQETADGIVSLLSPISRGNLGRAFAGVGLQLFFKTEHKQSAKAWDVIFKDEDWIQAIMSIDDPFKGTPQPALVGSDLLSRPFRSKRYLALTISDYTGDAIYEKQKLFKSFREQDYTYDEAHSEVYFNRSGLVLHIGEPVKCEGWTQMRDPRKLFRRYKRDVETAVMYYGDDCIHRIRPDQIGGVADYTNKGKKRIKYICSVPLRFRNGEPVCAVFFQSWELPIRLVSKKIQDGNRQWFTWRLATATEREWEHVDE